MLQKCGRKQIAQTEASFQKAKNTRREKRRIHGVSNPLGTIAKSFQRGLDVGTAFSHKNASEGSSVRERLYKLGRAIIREDARGNKTHWLLTRVAHVMTGIVNANLDRYSQYQKNPEKPVNFKRALGCGHIRNNRGTVTAIKSHKLNCLIHTHLQHCGAAWICPNCAARIQAERAGEVEHCIDWWATGKKKHVVAMMTLTASHHSDDKLKDIITLFTAAWTSMQRSKAWRTTMADGYFIRSAEVTNSDINGWHWHYHVLLLLDHKPDAQALKEVWLDKLVKFGFVDPGLDNYKNAVAHAFDFDVLNTSNSKAVSKYINKMAREVSFSASKIGRKKNHRTPFQILADAVLRDADNPEAWSHDLELWAEYAIATKGLAQLTFSRRLKEAAAIKDKTDEEVLADADADEEDEIAWGFRPESWHALMNDPLRMVDYRRLAVRFDFRTIDGWFRRNFPNAPALLDPHTAQEAYEYSKHLDEPHVEPAPDEEEKEAMDSDRALGVRVHVARMARQGDALAEAKLIQLANLDVPF